MAKKREKNFNMETATIDAGQGQPVQLFFFFPSSYYKSLIFFSPHTCLTDFPKKKCPQDFRIFPRKSVRK